MTRDFSTTLTDAIVCKTVINISFAQRAFLLPDFCGAIGHDAVQGSITVRPQPANPPVSRVATLAPAARAMAAINPSSPSRGVPAWRRAMTISG